MRTLSLILFAWTSTSLGIAIALGRVLRWLAKEPTAPVVPVDEWSEEQVFDEFLALVGGLDWNVR